MKFLLIILLSISCSSKKIKDSSKIIPTNESFKKSKSLRNSDVPDFYSTSVKTMYPALEEETLDRHTPDEIKALNSSSDPLVEISIKCRSQDFGSGYQIAANKFNEYQKVAAYWNVIANCHLDQGSFRKALLFYNKALEVAPNYVPALNNIGVMYTRQGQNQKALVAFERANKQSKFSKTPRYNLAKIYLIHGLSEQASIVFQSLLNSSPSDVDLLNSTANAYFLMSDYNRALTYYQRIPQTEWKRAEIGLNLALTLKKLNKKKEAVQVFALVKSPTASNHRNYYNVIKNQIGEAE